MRLLGFLRLCYGRKRSQGSQDGGEQCVDSSSEIKDSSSAEKARTARRRVNIDAFAPPLCYDDDFLALLRAESTPRMQVTAAFRLEKRATRDKELLGALRNASEPVFNELGVMFTYASPSSSAKYACDLTFLLLGSQSEHSAQWQRAVDAGIVEGCCEILKRSNLPSASVSALRVLCRLVRIRPGAEAVIRGKHHQVLVDTLTHSNTSLVSAALVCLYYLGADDEPTQELLESCGLVPILVTMISDPQSPVLSEAVQALKMITKSRTCCAAVEAAGARPLLTGITETCQDTRTRAVAQAALSRMNKANRQGSVSPDTKAAATPASTLSPVRMSVGGLSVATTCATLPTSPTTHCDEQRRTVTQDTLVFSDDATHRATQDTTVFAQGGTQRPTQDTVLFSDMDSQRVTQEVVQGVEPGSAAVEQGASKVVSGEDTQVAGACRPAAEQPAGVAAAAVTACAAVAAAAAASTQVAAPDSTASQQQPGASVSLAAPDTQAAAASADASPARPGAVPPTQVGPTSSPARPDTVPAPHGSADASPETTPRDVTDCDSKPAKSQAYPTLRSPGTHALPAAVSLKPGTVNSILATAPAAAIGSRRGRDAPDSPDTFESVSDYQGRVCDGRGVIVSPEGKGLSPGRRSGSSDGDDGLSWLPLPPGASQAASLAASTADCSPAPLMTAPVGDPDSASRAAAVPRLRLGLTAVNAGPLTRRNAAPAGGVSARGGVPTTARGTRTARGGPALFARPGPDEVGVVPLGSAWASACRAGAPNIADSMVLGSPVNQYGGGTTARDYNGAMTARCSHGALTHRQQPAAAPAAPPPATADKAPTSALTTANESFYDCNSATVFHTAGSTEPTPTLPTVPSVANLGEQSESGIDRGSVSLKAEDSSVGVSRDVGEAEDSSVHSSTQRCSPSANAAVGSLKPFLSIPPCSNSRQSIATPDATLTALTSSYSSARRQLLSYASTHTHTSALQHSHSSTRLRISKGPGGPSESANTSACGLLHETIPPTNTDTPATCPYDRRDTGSLQTSLTQPTHGMSNEQVTDVSPVKDASFARVASRGSGDPGAKSRIPAYRPTDAVSSAQASADAGEGVRVACVRGSGEEGGCGGVASGVLPTMQHLQLHAAVRRSQLPAIAAVAAAQKALASAAQAGRYGLCTTSALPQQGESAGAGYSSNIRTGPEAAAAVPAFMRPTAASAARVAASAVPVCGAGALGPVSTQSASALSSAAVNATRSRGVSASRAPRTGTPTGTATPAGPASHTLSTGPLPRGHGTARKAGAFTSAPRQAHTGTPVSGPTPSAQRRHTTEKDVPDRKASMIPTVAMPSKAKTGTGADGVYTGADTGFERLTSFVSATAAAAADRSGGATPSASAESQPGRRLSRPLRGPTDSALQVAATVAVVRSSGGDHVSSLPLTRGPSTSKIPSVTTTVNDTDGGLDAVAQEPIKCESPTRLRGTMEDEPVAPPRRATIASPPPHEDPRTVPARARALAVGASLQMRPALPEPGVCASPERDSNEDLLEIARARLGDFLLLASDLELCRDAEGQLLVLGEGGFGAVYRGVMHGVDEVAIKIAKKDRLSRDEMQQFIREVELLRRLHHRNIVQAYGVMLGPGPPCLVTELMRGGDLYHALRNHPALMKWDVLGHKVAVDIATGLNHLHRQNPPLMHRDLKSPNVLLSEEGVAKIADVGMSRTQCRDLVSAQPVMTPLWAAPEVLAKQPASTKCDMFSFGIVIWELVTGQDITTFQPLAVTLQLGAKGPNTLLMPDSAPAVARQIFESCTNPDPAERPNAAQVVNWLREATVASS